jgi:hypothetical protein
MRPLFSLLNILFKKINFPSLACSPAAGKGEGKSKRAGLLRKQATAAVPFL